MFISIILLLLVNTVTCKLVPNKLNILHTNDIHSHYDPTNKFGTDCQLRQIKEGNCFGGVTRLKTVVDRMKLFHPDSLLLDGGDQFQGTLYYNYFKGNATWSIMNQIGYDAMTVGNHEFDDGVNNLIRVIKEFQFPVISANMNLTRTPELNKLIKPYIYLEKYELAIVGYISEDTGKFLDPNLGVSFLDPITAVQKVIDELKSKGIKRIIALSHNGYEEDMNLASKTRGISLIVGGHSHTYLSNGTFNPNKPNSHGSYPTLINNLDQKPVYVVQAYCWLRFLGHLDIEFNNDGYLKHIKAKLIELTMDIPEDFNMLNLMKKLRTSFEDYGRRKIGETTQDFSLGVCSKEECTMGNLLTDAMLLYPRERRADIALINSSGIRATFSQGPITINDVLSVLPFENHIVQFELSGFEIITMLKSVIRKYRIESFNSPITSFIQISGLHFTYQPEKFKLLEVTIFNLTTNTHFPLIPNQIYQFITVDFIASGGDNIIYPPRTNLQPQELQSQGLIHYLETHSPIRPKLSHRIMALPSQSSSFSRQIHFKIHSN